MSKEGQEKRALDTARTVEKQRHAKHGRVTEASFFH